MHNQYNHPDTQSNPNSNPNPNPTTEQLAAVSIQLNVVTCRTFSEKFIRDNVVAPFYLSLLEVLQSPFQLCVTPPAVRCHWLTYSDNGATALSPMDFSGYGAAWLYLFIV